MLAGVLPTPAVALLALDLGVVISASHNPPEYNGVKFFRKDGSKLGDEDEEAIEALLDAPPNEPERGQVDTLEVAVDSYLDLVIERFGSDLAGLRVGVDCANGAYSGIAPRAFEELGAEVVAIGVDPTERTSTSAAAPPTCVRCRRSSAIGGSISALPSTATVTACSRSTRKAIRWTATRSSRYWPSPSESISSP